MPTSSSYILTPVLSFVSWLQPSSILDVGIGYGTWGLLFRQHVECPWVLEDGRPCWRKRIVGIEVWESYRNPLWEFAYDDVLVGDAQNLVGRLPADAFDLVVCLEVLEHLSVANGEVLLGELQRVGRHVVVSTPDQPLRQQAIDGNPYEVHKSHWSWVSLRRLGAVGRLPASGATIAVYSRDPRELQPWLRGLHLRVLGPLVPPRLRRAAQQVAHVARRHPGPPDTGVGPPLETA